MKRAKDHDRSMNQTARGRAGLLRHVPNAISIARLLSVPVLAWLAWQRGEDTFTALQVVSG
jgi:threonine/homoserine/homoserine lactone efflux protein